MKFALRYRGWKIYECRLAASNGVASTMFKCESTLLRQNDDHFKPSLDEAKKFVDSRAFASRP